ncbi:MAG: glycine cleavage system aminomethyltransferase GcvT [Alphaproteobacteria bacterium]|nr:glycine cleavage system aminomethyltransferase GcvT [Alphaproteobacteria bacterium]
MSGGPVTDNPLKRTPLHALHVELGAKMVPFAGYDMPVQYPTGILKEHVHTRMAAGLFDVSHMGQGWLIGTGADAALERLVPGELRELTPGRIRYTLLLNDAGGILDDLMVTRPVDRADRLFLVVNAACKDQDFAHIAAAVGHGLRVERLEDRALLALQGPGAALAMARVAPEAAAMGFMTARPLSVAGFACLVSRSGYTGEDGYEISVPAGDADALARALLADPTVKPIGLGARDSLRLEAGLCLYGHDIDTTTTPIEAGLAWTIGKRRRAEGGFPGAERILAELKAGPKRRRVGILPEGRAPAREHTQITDANGSPIGEVTSGGFGPTANGPIAMGYVAASAAAVGTKVNLVVRDQPRPARIVAMPFVPHRYHKA